MDRHQGGDEPQRPRADGRLRPRAGRRLLSDAPALQKRKRPGFRAFSFGAVEPAGVT
ncbi:hypothetical protein OF001_U200030 [Pseudomonas sp. OF001]|nr:hypothetical protein OF001_U200030 [Pseudomonas sp. OF001]